MTLAILLVAATAAGGGAPSAQPAEWALRWDRAPNATGCVDADGLSKAVESRIGHQVFADTGKATRFVEGHVAVVESRWHASLRVLDAAGVVQGTREVESAAERCDELADAVSLVVALLIEPVSVLKPSPPPAASPAPPPAPSPTPIADASVRTPSSVVPDESVWHARTGLSAVASFGSMPSLASALELSALLEPSTIWPIDVAIEGWLPEQVTQDNAGSRVWMLKLVAGVCPLALSKDRFFSMACAGLDGGLVDARGFGFDQNLVQDRFLADVWIRVRLGFRLASRLRLEAGVAGTAALARPQLGFIAADGSNHILYTFQPLGVEGGIGLAVDLL